MYLTAIIDVYSRYIVSWRLSNSLSKRFCIETLEDGLKVATPEIINTDQGNQYTSKEFSSKVIERFWSLVYLIYNFLEIERYKSNVKENLGAILDKIKIKNKADFIGFIYDKFNEGKSKQELLLNLGIPA